jgi:hypothetical protein
MARQPNSITFLPHRLTAVSGLQELPIADFTFDWDAILITRRGRTLTALEAAFVEMVDHVWHFGDAKPA